MAQQHIDLNQHPTKVLGPVSCFFWSCQMVGWQISAPLEVTTCQGQTLHLHHTPLKFWKLHVEQAWLNWAISKARMDPEMKPDHVPWATLKSLWSQRKMKDFPLALKFRTLGILSGSAQAQIRAVDQATCDFCNGREVGHCHLVLRCPATAHLRDDPRFRSLQFASVFTRCTGIPTMPKDLPRFDAPPGNWTFYGNTDRVYVFTDGSANPSSLPNVRLSSWAFCIADTWLGEVRPYLAGITPGSYHDISRAETYAVLASLESFALVTIFCDNQGVVQVLSKILQGTFDFFQLRGHPNIDLWERIYHLVLTRPWDAVRISKVKSHQKASSLSNPEDIWKTTGNDEADFFAKSTLETHSLAVSTTNADWLASNEVRRINQALSATEFPSTFSPYVILRLRPQLLNRPINFSPQAPPMKTGSLSP